MKPGRAQLAGIAFFAMLCSMSLAQAFDEAKYPDLRGAWVRTARPEWVQNGEKPAPLTAEYQAVYAANLAAQSEGNPGDAPQWYCLPQGMPMMMSAYDPMEIIVTADTTHILISHINDAYRRIYTDGRDWPDELQPSYAGYSIGRWIDETGSGRYDLLEVETRGLKNPRTFDTTGLPLHRDGKTIIKERIHLDELDRDTLHDEITVFDHALTEPWTVVKKYHRDSKPAWVSNVCEDGNAFVRIGKEPYYTSQDGSLMPLRKNQKPPDLHYFEKSMQSN